MNQPLCPEPDLPISALLERLDGYMHALAWRIVPRQVLAAETVDLDVEEIVQNARIKLWQALEREQQISNTRAYVRSIVHNESINLARARKRLEPLQMDEQGELSGSARQSLDEEAAPDPANVFAETEQLAETTRQATVAIHQLPPRQRQAITCSLRERIDDVLPLVAPLHAYDIDVTSAHWPVEPVEQHRLKALLSSARGKLRRTMRPNQSTPCLKRIARG
jgi:RNA polymerase sigma factor (sigma-70 family)